MSKSIIPNLPYSETEIQSRIGASSAAFDYNNPLSASDIALFRKTGLTKIEINSLRYPNRFDYRNTQQVSEIVTECKNQGVSIVSFHGPDFSYNSSDEKIRQASIKEAILAAEVAEQMGASIMVCHFGTDYQSEKSVTELLIKLENSNLKLANENGLEIQSYIQLADRIDSKYFGIVIDVGHLKDPDGTNPFTDPGRAAQPIIKSGSRLLHLHLHDFLDRDHFAPIGGFIQWNQLLTALRKINYKGLFMFEAMYPLGKETFAPERVLSQTAAFPKAFVQQYVTDLGNP